MKRKFEIVIVPGKNYQQKLIKITPLRQLKADMIGSMIRIRAMVVRVSEVKPLISLACYLCEICGYEMYQPVHGRNYNPLTDCISPVCRNNNNRGRIIPNFSVSKFVPFQEIKIQETSDQCPIGCIPRAFTVHCKGSITRQCTPGDIINLTGVF